MSNDPVKPGADADELLGRWLAHHDKDADPERTLARPLRVPLAARPSEAAAPRTTRPSAAAVLAELREPQAVDGHDGPGRVAPPSTFGVRRGLPGAAYSGPTGTHARGADSDVAELDRQAPDGFEPVILRSVRKKTEAKEEPEHKLGRFGRLRSRTSGPVEQPDAADLGRPATLDDTPGAVVPAPVFKSSPPTPAPAPPPTKIVSFEDVIARAAAAALPVVEPETQPEPQPEVEPVLPGPDTEPAPVTPPPAIPDPDPQEPDVPSAAVVEAPTKRRLLIRTKRPRPEMPKQHDDRKRHAAARTVNASSTGTAGAARGLLAAARAATPIPPLASETREPTLLEPVSMLPLATVVESDEPSAPPMEMPTVYEFTPRRSMRRFLSLMFLGGLAAAGYLGYGAYQSKDTIEIGIAGIVALAALVIWAIRAGATVTRLTIKSGQLEIVRQGARMVFDLASTYTTIEVTGQPGTKKWKVRFLRPGMAPVAVDSTMVDGRDFMRVLGFYRPELLR